MQKILSFFLLATLSAIAANAKEQYQDAIFLKAESVAKGSDCLLNGTVDAQGNIDGSERCKPHYAMEYKVALDGYIYTLGRAVDHPARAMFMNWPEGIGVLSSATPKGTAIKIKFSKNSEHIYVKVGKRESRYRILPGTIRQ